MTTSPILRIDSGKINEILPEEVRAQSQALKNVSRSEQETPYPSQHTCLSHLGEAIREGEPSHMLGLHADPAPCRSSIVPG